MQQMMLARVTSVFLYQPAPILNKNDANTEASQGDTSHLLALPSREGK